MKRTAIISDIHGNLEALKAVLADIETKGCDEIICLGDVVAKGKHNHECAELVRKTCAVAVRGNCDAYFSLDPDSVNSEREKNLIRAYQKTMEPDDIAWLRTLPDCHEFMLSGRLVRMVHAGPDSFNNYSSNTLYASPEEKYSMFLPGRLTCSKKRADVVIYGHTHQYRLEQMDGRIWLNPGSCERPRYGNGRSLALMTVEEGIVTDIRKVILSS